MRPRETICVATHTHTQTQPHTHSLVCLVDLKFAQIKPNQFLGQQNCTFAMRFRFSFRYGATSRITLEG